MRFAPFPYQQHAIDWIKDHKAAGLFLEMGLGKTVITLTAVKELLQDFEIHKVLVIAPLRVAHTVWAEEAQKWDHLTSLRVSKVLGSEAQRLAALDTQADIYVINRQNVYWLAQWATKHRKWSFDTVVIDELSSFKSAASQRFKALRRIRPAINRIVGLTGTPAPNGLIDLWSQVYLLDQGQRLGKTLGGYRTQYFDPGQRNGAIVYNWTPKAGAQKAVYGKLTDLCVSMRSQDYLTMPGLLMRHVKVQLPAEANTAIELFKRTLAMQIGQSEITAQSAAVLAGKLLQMANGAAYGGNGEVLQIHDAKLDALEDLIEAANGQPMLVYYAFKHDLERIMKRFPQARQLVTAQDVTDWNAGKIPVLLAHPDSAGHGLNLQAGGHIMVWFGLTWSLEKYQQANARLYRQGQKQPVTIYHLLAQGTIDQRVTDILAGKEQRQDALIDAVKAEVFHG